MYINRSPPHRPPPLSGRHKWVEILFWTQGISDGYFPRKFPKSTVEHYSKLSLLIPFNLTICRGFVANILSQLSDVVLSQTLVYLHFTLGISLKLSFWSVDLGGGPETEFPPSSQLMPIMLAFLNQHSWSGLQNRIWWLFSQFSEGWYITRNILYSKERHWFLTCNGCLPLRA